MASKMNSTLYLVDFELVILSSFFRNSKIQKFYHFSKTKSESNPINRLNSEKLFFSCEDFWDSNTDSDSVSDGESHDIKIDPIPWESDSRNFDENS